MEKKIDGKWSREGERETEGGERTVIVNFYNIYEKYILEINVKVNNKFSKIIYIIF